MLFAEQMPNVNVLVLLLCVDNLIKAASLAHLTVFNAWSPTIETSWLLCSSMLHGMRWLDGADCEAQSSRIVAPDHIWHPIFCGHTYIHVGVR